MKANNEGTKAKVVGGIKTSKGIEDLKRIFKDTQLESLNFEDKVDYVLFRENGKSIWFRGWATLISRVFVGQTSRKLVGKPFFGKKFEREKLRF